MGDRTGGESTGVMKCVGKVRVAGTASAGCSCCFLRHTMEELK